MVERSCRPSPGRRGDFILGVAGRSVKYRICSEGRRIAFALTKAVERHMLSNAASGPHTMKTYGQFCPLAQATQLLCERWTLIVVRELMAGSSRFGELQHGAP